MKLNSIYHRLRKKLKTLSPGFSSGRLVQIVKNRALATLFGNCFLLFVGLKRYLPDRVPGGRGAQSDSNQASPDGISLAM